MHADRNRFFREATLCICGSLEASKFLHESLTYIQDFIPADWIYLVQMQPEQGRQQLLARADSQAGTSLDVSFPMPEGAGSHPSEPSSEAVITERASQLPEFQPWIDNGICAGSDSLLMIHLIIGRKTAGSVVFHAHGSGRFTQEHADLISLLAEPFAIALVNGTEYQQLFGRKELLAEDNRFLRSELFEAAGEEIVGATFGLRGVMDHVRRIASLSSPVLLSGEHGTGKQVIARAIHSLSRRVEHPFVTVNCSAVPDNLLAVELFGNQPETLDAADGPRGVLPRRHGKVALAAGGTIFFEKIDQLSAQAQDLLLRVADASTAGESADPEQPTTAPRMIAAADPGMSSHVDSQRFPTDLHSSLSADLIVIPPLRERTGDIIALVQHFLLKFAREMGLADVPQVTPEAYVRLQAYHWPGNVRELENVVEREIMRGDVKSLTFEDLQEADDRWLDQPAGEPLPGLPDTQLQPLDDVIARHIRQVLRITGGKVGGVRGAAEILAINPSTLRKRMRKLGIPFGRKARS